jgi:hypothetical protein
MVWNRSCGGGGPRSSRLELTGERRGTEVEWFGGDPERSGTGLESFGTEVNGLEVTVSSGRTEVEWFGSERERLRSELEQRRTGLEEVRSDHIWLGSVVKGGGDEARAAADQL